ncbi:hypothetical protein HII36_42745 [Nonomuraea sp. NN258]|uniref:permease-like cell division protein FtsX n=1 Tax=Nonomuraea antri TaxID=2730852 RepID=UPI001569E95E|nr:permease-like cell division protein FtsX [Nonomuraea antri]NRQ38501.1 hypothetical protein [Nonomuraea antri]
MKHWLWRVAVAGVVALSGITAGTAHAAPADPASPEVGMLDEPEIAVFLCVPGLPGCGKRYATAGQRRDVEARLKAIPEVTGVRFVSRAAAYASFRKEYAGRTVLAKVRAKDMPDSFRMRVSGIADRDKIVAAARRGPGVGVVIDQVEVRVAEVARAQDADLVVFLCRRDDLSKACHRGRGRANKSAVTAGERKAIAAAVERTSGLESYEYLDQAAAYRRFVEAYPDDEDLLSVIKVSDMPESYRLWLRTEADRDAARKRLARLPGVSEVYDSRCTWREAKLFWEYGLWEYWQGTKNCVSTR